MFREVDANVGTFEDEAIKPAFILSGVKLLTHKRGVLQLKLDTPSFTCKQKPHLVRHNGLGHSQDAGRTNATIFEASADSNVHKLVYLLKQMGSQSACLLAVSSQQRMHPEARSFQITATRQADAQCLQRIKARQHST